MSRTIEVELKFEILDTKKVEEFLKNSTFVGEKHIVDVYLDTREGDMFQKGVFIRIRNNSIFNIKYNKEDLKKTLDDKVEHGHCDEITYSLPLANDSLNKLNDVLTEIGLNPLATPSIDELKKTNNLVESVVLDKHRQSYKMEEYEIDIDTVANLGEYLEIEKMTDEKIDPNGILEDMKKLLQGLDLHRVDVGYNELYWRKHDFDLYLKGKYLVLEDRKKYRKHTL